MLSRADIRAALSQPEDEEGLIFELNSGGGSVYDGYEMYTVLKNSARKSTVEIQSIAASAASVFAMAADTVLISPVASIMIHRASTGTIGNEEDMNRSAQMLRTVDQGILNAYEAKCSGKVSREELEELMKNETFMTAGEAVERGFADGILWQTDDPDARLTKLCHGHGRRNAGGHGQFAAAGTAEEAGCREENIIEQKKGGNRNAHDIG